MRPLVIFCVALFVPFVIAEEYRKSRDYHLNSIDFQGSLHGGCRKKHPENRSLPGGAEACVSHKPLKMKGLDKVGKRLCGDGYEYCSVSHKSLHRLSWRSEDMPRSCLAFHYKKNKFAGYGHNCHRNNYYDGMLCCPIQTDKTNHSLRIGSNKFQNYHKSLKHAINYVKKK